MAPCGLSKIMDIKLKHDFGRNINNVEDLVREYKALIKDDAKAQMRRREERQESKMDISDRIRYFEKPQQHDETCK